MGMAASQARYLGLTARKTNVEYEGQQVNQQRTALANQSANLFNQLMGLTVPTPPSTQEFTKVQYNYNDGTNEETITSITPLSTTDPEYNYQISHYHISKAFTGVETKTTNPQVKAVKNAGPPVTYDFTFVGNSEIKKYDSSDATQVAEVAQLRKETALKNSNFVKTTDDSKIYVFKSGGNNYYACEADLIASYESTSGAIDNQAQLNKYNSTYLDKKIETTEKASLTVDPSGRFTSVKVASSSAVYNMKTTTTTDENAYNDAMNKYTYENQRYQKKVEDINAQTKVIQEEDRTLELRLRQLDTEQQALATEMDAVKKVIDKNIDSTFKTFS